MYSSIPSTSPAEVIQPPIAQAESKSANEILRLKRQQAIQQALLRQASPNPNPVTQSPLAQNSVIANSQALMEQSNPEKSDPILDDDVSNSSLPLGDFSYYPEVKNTTKNNEHPVDKRKNSKVMIKNDTSRSTSKPTKLKEDEIVVVPHPNMMELDDGLVFIRITPPWISNPILDPDDLSWDRFGTLENSLSLRGDDSNWVDGVRYELNLDGLNTTQRICLYPVDYQNCLKLKSTSKIISAEILNSGSPNCSMRAYALARKFMAQFCQAIKSSECATKLKQLAKKIWIVDAFPVHHDFENHPRFDKKFIPGQDEDMLPHRVGSPGPLYDPALQLTEEEPSRIFFMEERIQVFARLMLPIASKNQHCNQ
ncbi:hypothetical protein PSTT_07637 [Puccinia striiformis]|uniref:Uncharacterized protein n=1 Tax=Puccinia striiformis TaxID=27350 RepID=A0A2S4VFT7_9BASI|nr:hypothetical protein PSTT_07637 [Puccinia striiformis]